jgi:hypothetical protein
VGLVAQNLQHFQTAHARHFQVESHQIGQKFPNFLKGLLPASGLPHHLDAWKGLKNQVQRTAEKQRIVGNQHPHEL